MRKGFLSELIFAVFLLQNSAVTSGRMLDIARTEGIPVGTVLLNLQSEYNNRVVITYRIGGSDVEVGIFKKYFSIEPGGMIRTRHNISRDDIAFQLGSVSSPVIFRVNYTVGIIDEVRISLRIMDVNNKVPVFQNYENGFFRITFPEGAINSAYLPLATDNDEGANSVQSYTLSSTFKGLFMLDVRREKGVITDVRLVQNGTLDAEVRSNYIVNVTASEGISNPRSATLKVNITVNNICDNAPYFPVPQYLASIKANAPIGYLVLSGISATDADYSDGGMITYRVTELCVHRHKTINICESWPLNESPFDLDSVSGDLRINKRVDRETVVKYEVSIAAVDRCQMRSTAVVIVTIEDVPIVEDVPIAVVHIPVSIDDQELMFSPQLLAIVEIPEDQEINTTVFVLNATTDNNTEISYAFKYSLMLDNFPFQVNTTSGHVTLKTPLDYEKVPRYDMMVMAFDGRQIGIMNVSVLVSDVNDQRCSFGRHDGFMAFVGSRAPQNYSVMRINATDKDTPTDQLRFRIEAGNEMNKFAVHERTGEIFLMTSLDSDENVSNYSLTISCSDGYKLSTEINITVVVIEDESSTDTTPFISHPTNNSYYFSISEKLRPLTLVGAITVDSDSRYQILSVNPAAAQTWFDFNNITGQLFTTRELDREDPALSGTNYSQITLTVQALNTLGLEQLLDLNIEITDQNDNDPVFNPNHLNISVAENTPLGSSILTVRAVDRDISPNNQIHYLISLRSPLGTQEFFHIDLESGLLTLNRRMLDYEVQDVHWLEILAIDPEYFSKQDTLNITIYVKDSPELDVTAPQRPRGLSAPVIAGILVTVIVVMAIVLIILCFVVGCYFRGSKQDPKKLGKYLSYIKPSTLGDVYRHTQSNYPHKAWSNMGAVESTLLGQGEQDKASLFKSFSVSNLLIPSRHIQLINLIGQGEFGLVYRSHLTGWQGRTTAEVVAVKTMKNFITKNHLKDLMTESERMQWFNHPNVMSLIGVCIDAGAAPYIVMPFMANGSLLTYLKKKRPHLTITEEASSEMAIQDAQKKLLSICIQIAKGMRYLSAQRFVHRDLAARNCMIDDRFIIKVGDFGLMEDMYCRNYFRQEKGEEDSSSVKLPIKWMALESLLDEVFSEKTDVWSFGVTCWEVFSLGHTPYPGLHPLALVEFLKSGERLPRPSNTSCTHQVYDLLIRCWNEVPEKRPSFEDLVHEIGSQLQEVAGYLELGEIQELVS